MNNLTTRKIVLGMLMTLVLAFSVQGVAEAITRPSAQTEAHVDTVDSDVHDVGGIETVPTTNITPDKANRNETVAITKSSGVILRGDFYGLSRVDLTEVDDDLKNTENGSSFTYTRDGRTQTLSGTATGRIAITFTAKGKQWVKISATDYDDPDVANDFSGSWSTTYTYYVKGPGTSTTTTSLLGLSNGYKTGIFYGEGHRERIHTGDGSHYAVEYEIIPDTGQVQIETPAGAEGGLTSGTDPKETSSAFDVWLQANATYQVTAKVKGSDPGVETVGVYIIGTPTLTVGYPGRSNGITDDPPLTSEQSPDGRKENGGRINQVLPKAFSAHVTDGNITEGDTPGNVPGVVVTFRVKGSGNAGGYLVFDSRSTTSQDSRNLGILVTSNNRPILDANGKEVTMATDKTLHIRTNTNGLADVNFQLGTDRKQDVTVSAVRQTKTVSAYAGESTSGNQLVEPSSVVSRALGRAGEYELRVKAVDEDGKALYKHHVEFTTSDGTLEDPVTANSKTNRGHLQVRTDTQGIAFIFFDPKDSSSSPRVTAHLFNTSATAEAINPNDTVVDDVVFNIGGTVTRPRDETVVEDVAPTNRLEINVSGTGATRSVTVNAVTATGNTLSGLAVTLSGTALTAPQTVVSGTATTITLPTAPGDYTLQAIVPGYTVAQTTLTVAAPPQPGTLSIQRVGDRVGDQQAIRVTAQTAEGGVPSSTVLVTLTGATTPSSFTIPAGDGSRSLTVTLPSTTAAHVLTVSATGYGDDSVIVPAAGTGQQTGTPDTTRTVAGEADSIEIDGQRQRSGTVNQNIPLRVQVTDANGNGVGNVKVTFRVLAPGRGRLSQRGNGRAIQDTTDARGYASATLTPLGEGNLIVRVNAGEISPVTFIIAVGEASEAETDTGTRDTDVTPSREIRPVVQVNASQRPPMLWVDGGAIYALVGASVQEFASGVDNALNIAVGGGKVYWTEKTGDSAGTINSANLNGSNVQELASILAVPMGIAVDAANSKLYWTNSRGRIQSANLDGSGITNVIPSGLEGAMDLAVAGGNAYWTQGGNVRFVNLTGQKQIRDISTGMDTANSLAIGGGKVYWAEMTGESAGTVNSANLNGTGATELAAISAVPSGIAVDTARSKLYWTNSRGRIQRANLNGSGIGNVVTGLGNPGDMVSSNSITAPAATPPTTTTTAPASKKYDVNGDGTVDSKDVDAIIVAVAAKITDAKYDVTGDGTVDINDVVAVSANQDTGAAAAPALLGTQLSSVQIDRLQEQIDLLIASNDRSPDALRILTYLQQLIVMARPEKTQLLANYPNPFNPETWIPYELATDTDVRITIYNTQGVVIRTLALGHQSAGYYTGRDRAAYWDGRNALGEQVASGIYFYQFETDEMSSMRKMVILK